MIRYMKKHLSLIVPLFVLLFSFEFFIMTNESIDKYEDKMLGNYSILISSQKELKNLKTKLPFIEEYKLVETNNLVDKFKSTLSDNTIKDLKKSMPYYYKVKLSYFPSSDIEIANIKTSLSSIDEIQKVEMFTSSLNSSKNSLAFIKFILNVFIIFCFLVTIMLMLKQMKIWNLKYNKQIFIMKLFGAGFLFRTALIYRFVLLDSIIASLITAVSLYFMQSSSTYQLFYQALGLSIGDISLIDLLIKFLLISIIISISIVTLTFGPLHQDDKSR
ncbi:MAG: Unknown protein [uncultured Campylobacterales bacterium]|uniref:Cell division protein FtsX n=1 Tax=uncultured Campylobacterales bacterium TaxID=352960 RepID=A0A6S6SYA3_9BACT|nr:MAG: Unknown protein [uncultured Campylobacterales bacterium]